MSGDVQTEAKEFTDRFYNSVYLRDYIIKSDNECLFIGSDGKHWLSFTGIVRQVEPGYFIKFVEAIGSLNADETLEYLRDELRNKRIKFV